MFETISNILRVGDIRRKVLFTLLMFVVSASVRSSLCRA